MSYKFSVIIEQEGQWHVALCPELDVASQGRTIEEAMDNLKEAVKLYLETASKEEVAQVLSSPHASPLVTTLDIAV